MKQEFTYPSSNRKTKVHAIRWIPDGEIRAVLQIAHGMNEYIGRYERFAEFLNQHGILVTGNDHLGHGKTAETREDLGYFGHPKGNKAVLSDIHRLRLLTERKYPDLPYFVLGHSMGSFLIRQYLEYFGKGLQGAIVMGTGSQPPAALHLAKAICRGEAVLHSWHYRSRLVNDLAFSAYNKRLEPVRTGHDWLTKDESIVDAYEKDPYCMFMFTVNAYYQMFLGIEEAQNPANIVNIPKDIPIFLVSGEEDPVGHYGADVQKVAEEYRDAGILEVRTKLYPDDRHEILNEPDREQVYQDLLEWLEEHL